MILNQSGSATIKTDMSDATVTAKDIVTGKTVYDKTRKKLTGTSAISHENGAYKISNDNTVLVYNGDKYKFEKDSNGSYALNIVG